jgi:hypothetical protein
MPSAGVVEKGELRQMTAPSLGDVEKSIDGEPTSSKSASPMSPPALLRRPRGRGGADMARAGGERRSAAADGERRRQ